MAYNYHNWGLAGAAQRKYGNEFYDRMLMFHEMGVLFKMLFGVVVLLTAVISIPVLLIVWICYRHQKKEIEALNEGVNARLLEYDMSSREDFARLIGELIKDCSTKGYKFTSPVKFSGDMTFHFKQSIDDIGVALIREAFGEEVKPNRAFVTNRGLTSQARKYCDAALIMVIDRDALSDLIAFQITSNKASVKRQK